MTKLFSLEELSSLLGMLEERDVVEFQLERGSEKLKLRREGSAPPSVWQPGALATPQFSAPAPQPVAPAAEQAAPKAQPAPTEGGAGETKLTVVEGSAEPASNLREITSPMVGTFYRRPSPDARPYVDVGDVITKGSVLCIVEAMKLMNEIEAELSGKIVEVCLEDGQMVEYGEVLFRVDPTA